MKSAVLSEIRKDVAVLREKKNKGHGSDALEDYIHYYNGVLKEGRANKAGVCIIIRNLIAGKIKSGKLYTRK